MPEPKTRKKAKRPVRFVKAAPEPRKSGKRAAPRKATPRTSAVRRRAQSAPRSSEADFPTWRQLSGKDADGARRDFGGLFATVSTLRLALLIIAVSALVTLYVGHVYATTDLLAEVDTLRRENLELHLQRNQVKAAFDRASSPSRIAARARQLGLVEAVPSGAPIRLRH